MAISSQLSAQLRLLATSLDGDPDSLPDVLADLVSWIRRAVPSYCGLRLILLDHGWPVTLTELTDAAESTVTSVRVPLQAMADAADHGEAVLEVFATAPGAFGDLAADLSHALNLPITTADGGDQHRWDAWTRSARAPAAVASIALDAASLPAGSRSGLSGLLEVSTINQAIGILIDRGHQPQEAHDLIRGGASCAGIAPHLFAARLLPPDNDHGAGRER